jgi:hypothetical protein
MAKPNVVNFQYAQLLKKHKFLSPPPEDGQYWYDKFGTLHLLLFIDGVFYECDPESKAIRDIIEGAPTLKEQYFAPSVEYIEYIQTITLKTGALKPAFITFEKSGIQIEVGYDPNAYAQKWLDENKKPEED